MVNIDSTNNIPVLSFRQRLANLKISLYSIPKDGSLGSHWMKEYIGRIAWGTATSVIWLVDLHPWEKSAYQMPGKAEVPGDARVTLAKPEWKFKPSHYTIVKSEGAFSKRRALSPPSSLQVQREKSFVSVHLALGVFVECWHCMQTTPPSRGCRRRCWRSLSPAKIRS